MSEPAKKMGRPSAMTEAAQSEILERIGLGESLRSICDDERLPGMSSVFRYLADDANAKFREQYARAREAQADALFDDVLTIADDGRNDWMEKNSNGSVSWVENGEALRRSQLRIDARKWMAGKLAPKKYGDKLIQEVAAKIETSEPGAPRRPSDVGRLAGAATAFNTQKAVH